LRQFLGDGTIMYLAVKMINYSATVAFEQSLKAGLVTAADLQHQDCIGIESPLGHALLNVYAHRFVTLPIVTFSKVVPASYWRDSLGRS
jgi:hypothetical protein